MKNSNSNHATPSHKRPSKAKKSSSGHASNARSHSSESSDNSQLDADARELAQQQPVTSRDQTESVAAEDAVETSENAENGSIERDSTHELPTAKGRHAQKRSASSAPSKRSSSETADR